MLLTPRTYLLSVAVWTIFGLSVTAQLPERSDSLVIGNDSIIGADTTQIVADSTHVKKKKTSDITTKIDYSAQDSMAYSADNKKIYLYGKAKVTYGDVELKADYIEYNFNSRLVYASGLPDSTGKIQGKPEFTQKKEKFTSEKLNYNFKTKKGVIYNIVTEQEGGFLHAEKTKRLDNGQVDIKNGKYTTCNAEHPHFYLALKEGVVIPDDKIVFRSAYLVIEDIPIFPIFVPFGFFPNRRENTSGVIMPTFGSESTRGYSLTNGGYYFAINDYTDLRVIGNVYSNGSWSMNAYQRYLKRYKYNGNFSLTYAIDKNGEKDVNLQSVKNFSLLWSHSQDAKANPSSRFTANVNYTTTGYDRSQNYTNPLALTTNQKSSTVSYSKTWTYFVLSTNLNFNTTTQPTGGQTITGGLPTVTFNTSQSYYPFRRKNASGTLKWYENIGLSYSSAMANNINTTDSALFTSKTLRTAKSGFQHSVPLSVNFKVLKYFNITPSLGYQGILQTMHFVKTGIATFNPSNHDTTYTVKVDTIRQLAYTQGFTPTLGVSFNQPWYGMVVFGKNSKISKIRHVITPSIGFSFVPPINQLAPNYSKTYQTGTRTSTQYSIYDGTLYGTPHSSQRSGSFSFGLSNNLEMKVKSEKDTVTGEKKIVLIQSLNFSSGYNLYASTQKLSPISFNGTIPVIKNLNLTFGGIINPYATKIGRPNPGDSLHLYFSNDYAWQQHQGIGKITSFNIALGYTIQSGQGAKPADNTQGTNPNPNTPDQLGPNQLNKAQDKKIVPESDYNYFKIPWSFTCNYTYNYNRSANSLQTTFQKSITQNFTFSGNFSLTPKWKMTFRSAYDFQAKQISYTGTSFSIQRDLHCWVMSIDFNPFGTYKYYTFRINALSSLLRDLKYEKRHTASDNPGYNLY